MVHDHFASFFLASNLNFKFKQNYTCFSELCSFLQLIYILQNISLCVFSKSLWIHFADSWISFNCNFFHFQQAVFFLPAFHLASLKGSNRFAYSFQTSYLLWWKHCYLSKKSDIPPNRCCCFWEQKNLHENWSEFGFFSI